MITLVTLVIPTHAREVRMSENKRTRDNLYIIEAALKAGSSLRGAAAQVGCSAEWLRLWRNDDPEVAEAVEIAIAEWEQEAVEKINDNEDWKASAWLLARRFPDDYGDRQRVELTSFDPKVAKNEARRLLGLEPLPDDE